MAISSYRVKRWLRNSKDWRNYLVYRTLAGANGESVPRVIPITLAMSVDNELFPDDLGNLPEWFVNADFTLATNAGAIDFTWVTDHWETTGEFPGDMGVGYLTQDGNTHIAQWTGAEYDVGPAIEQTNNVYWMSANGSPILWSGE